MLFYAAALQTLNYDWDTLVEGVWEHARAPDFSDRA